nr:MAG TPA: hypothetical protein [Caudoviricetes sp.]
MTFTRKSLERVGLSLPSGFLSCSLVQLCRQ